MKSRKSFLKRPAAALLCLLMIIQSAAFSVSADEIAVEEIVSSSSVSEAAQSEDLSSAEPAVGVSAISPEEASSISGNSTAETSSDVVSSSASAANGNSATAETSDDTASTDGASSDAMSIDNADAVVIENETEDISAQTEVTDTESSVSRTDSESDDDASADDNSSESGSPDSEEETEDGDIISEDALAGDPDYTFSAVFTDVNFRAFLAEYPETKEIFSSLPDDSVLTEEILENIKNIKKLIIAPADDTDYKTDLSKIEKLDGITLFENLEELDISGTSVKDFDEKALTKLKTFIKGEITSAQFRVSGYSAVYDGSTEFKPAVSVYCGDTLLTNGTDYTLTYSDNKNVGTACVTVSGTGSYKGEKKLYFNVYPAAASVSADNNSASQLTVNISSKNTSDANIVYHIAYSVNADMTGASYVTSTIKSAVIKNLTPLTTYYLTVYAEYTDGTVTLTGAVSPTATAYVKKDISTLTCQTSSSAVYTGGEIKPAVSVNGLTEGKDFTVSYSSNKDIGTAKVSLTGIGNYTGTLSSSFDIVPCEVSVSSVADKSAGAVTVSLSSKNPSGVSYVIMYADNKEMKNSSIVSTSSLTADITGLNAGSKYYFSAYAVSADGKLKSSSSAVTSWTVRKTTAITKIVLSKTSYTYNGKAKKPSVKVYSGDTLLDKSSYSVSYKNNKNAGKATVTVTGKGFVTGTVSSNYLIKPTTPTLTKVINTNEGGELTVEFTPLQGATTRIYYSTDKNFKNKKYVDAVGSSASLTGLKENTTYYIKARAYVKYGSKKYWSSYSDVTSKKSKISISGAKCSVTTRVTYTGKALKPAPKVKLNGKTLKKGTDYKLVYSSNKKVGRAIVEIRGKGSYAGTCALAFYVMPKIPTISKAAAKNGTLSFSWSKSTGAAGYAVEYSKNSDFSSKKTLYYTTETSGSVSGLELGVKYYVRVRAYFMDEETKVYTDYSKSVKSSLSSSKNYARIATAGKMYASDSTDSEVIMNLSVGDLVKVIDTTGTLAKISCGGKTGYVYKSIYSMGPKFTGVTNKETVLYSNTKKSKKLATLAAGTSVSVTAISGSMYKVKVGDDTGYVAKSAVAASISPSGSSSDSAGLTVYTGNLTGGAFGIDISEHNGYIDYTKLVGKVDFIVIRCGYGSDFASQDDKLFSYNVAQCEKYGIPYGLYLFSYADTVSKAKSEASHALRLASACNPTLGIWYDIEWDGMPYTKSTINGIISSFCDTVSAAGYRTGLYTYCMYYKSRLVGTNALDYKIWMAQYNNNNELASISCAWQFTSTYTMAGVSGYLDGSYAYSSFFS